MNHQFPIPRYKVECGCESNSQHVPVAGEKNARVQKVCKRFTCPPHPPCPMLAQSGRGSWALREKRPFLYTFVAILPTQHCTWGRGGLSNVVQRFHQTGVFFARDGLSKTLVPSVHMIKLRTNPRQTDWQLNKQTSNQNDRHARKQTAGADKQTDSQTDRQQTGAQTIRQTDGQAKRKYMHV